MSQEKSATDYLKGWRSWRITRYYFFIALTAFFLILPWITVNGNHFFLLSFDKLKLHLMFVQFDMQEMYLMPFLLMLMFIGIFGMTVLGGRVFCGWICPQTIFRVIYRDLIETKLLGIRKRIKNKQIEPDYSESSNQIKRVVAILLWTALSFIATANLLWFFVPPEDFFAYLANPTEHLMLVGILVITALFLVADIVMIKEDWCEYVCPYSRIQSVLYDEDTVMTIYDPHRGGAIYNENSQKQVDSLSELHKLDQSAECTMCESCVTICPTHIDIRQGLQLACINCLECSDACTQVMGKLGKPSLIRWSSEKEVLFQNGKTDFFRPKIKGYIATLLAIVVILGLMGSEKELMLLNINKENRLYSIDIDRDTQKVRVKNDYIFLLQNTQDVDHKYYFDVIAPKEYEGKIMVLKPSEPFKVKPNIKKKKIVTLYTPELLVQEERKDTVIPITIRAYAIDAKDTIVVERKSTFVFPRYDKYKEGVKQ